MSVGRTEFSTRFGISCFVGSSIAHVLIYSPKIRSIIQRWFGGVRYPPALENSDFSEKSTVIIRSLPRALSAWKPLEESVDHSLAHWEDSTLVRDAKTLLNTCITRKVFDVAMIVNDRAHQYFIAILEDQGLSVFISDNCIAPRRIGKGSFGVVEKVPGKIAMSSGDKIDFSMAVKTFKEAKKASIEWNSNQLIKDIDHVVRCLARGVVLKENQITASNFLMFKFFEEGDLIDCLSGILVEKIPFQERYRIGMKIFNELAETLRKIHERGFICNDLKLENVLIESESVFVTDFNQIDPSSLEIIGTSKTMFPQEYKELKKNLGDDCRKQIRQRIDVRQLAFLMYGFFGTEIQDQKETCIAFPYPYRKKIVRDGRDWPDTSHPYVELRGEVASDVRQLIKDMLDPDEDKVPDIQAVCQGLKDISSGKVDSFPIQRDQNATIL